MTAKYAVEFRKPQNQQSFLIQDQSGQVLLFDEDSAKLFMQHNQLDPRDYKVVLVIDQEKHTT